VVNLIKNRRIYLCAFAILAILATFIVWSSIAEAQQFQRAQTPIVGRYPGGHTGLRNAAYPQEEGLGWFVFNRFHKDDSLKNASGQTIGGAASGSYTIVNGLEYVTDFKILGMKYGAMVAVPFINGAYNRKSGPSAGAAESTMGISDIIVMPLMLFGTSQYLDYQIAVGNFFPTGSYTAGSTLNRGAGYWEIMYSVGSAYYPTGDRKGFAISAVARIEQNFRQPGTDIQPGDSITVDFGIDHPIAFPANHKYIFDVGLSGFVTTQITRESGTNAALNTTPYRLFALGPEVDWIMPAYQSKLILRPQWEFGAVNMSQGWTVWLGFMHMFGNIF